jgi:hypothetical protein
VSSSLFITIDCHDFGPQICSVLYKVREDHGNEDRQLAPSDNGSTKSAAARVATGAAWLKCKIFYREEKEKPT